MTITARADFDTMTRINTAVEEGREVTINGDRVFAGWRKPAHLHGTGSISVEMEARTRKGRSRTAYFKPGTTLTITIA